MPEHFDKERVAALIGMLKPARLTRIVDIGANPIHVPDYDALRQMGGCEVWGFEPQPEAHAALVANARPGETYLPHAIGTGEDGTLHVCASGGFTSLLPPDKRTLDHLGRWHKAMQVVETLPVKTRRLDDIAELPPPDFLKIDIQGGERDVFGNGREKLKQAVAVVTEVGFVPLYQNQPLFHDQAAELAAQGFDLVRFLTLKSKALGGPSMATLDWRRHQGQLIDGDALFMRRMIGADWGDEALKHLAILADAVFETFDLAIRCLDILLERGKLGQGALDGYLAHVPHQKAAR
ncbi:MAG: FkbM family methyltransferase [Rhodobacteraceae bacterium]|nr:FkbM family methyltransferase [Paracoccaceae bacterium]